MMMQTTTQKAANPSSSTRDSGGPRSAKRPRDDDNSESHFDRAVDFTDRASVAQNAALVCECLDGIRDYANQTVDPVPWRECLPPAIILRVEDHHEDGPLAPYLADWMRADAADEAHVRAALLLAEEASPLLSSSGVY